MKPSNKNALIVFTALVLIIMALSAGFYQCRLSGGYADRTQLSIPPLPDFSTLTIVAEKKRAFFEYFSVLANAVNQSISRERERAKKLSESSDLSEAELVWLRQVAHRNGLDWALLVPADADFGRLLARLDGLPVALVLSQAAIESAWGASRFAREGNNFFGQWCYSKGCGLVPASRTKHARHEVKVFESPIESVRAFFDNLNRNSVYEPLRRLRERARNSSAHVSACQLAEGLKRYSERGSEYVAQVKSLIRSNALESSVHCRVVAEG